MSNFREKSQTFFLGLMAGLIIAGTFFILKLDNYFKELNFYKNVAKTFHSDTKVDETSIKAETAVPVKEKKTIESSIKNNSVSSIDSSKTIPVNKSFVLDADSLNRHSSKDSLVSNNTSREDIVVKKDELLTTKTLEVINLNPTSNHGNSKDSLLQKVSGIKDDKNYASQFFNIELWQSPLNYKGYKMSKYKIVLYGIASTDGLKVYSVDDVVYLKNAAAVYKLDNSSEFKSYERINDESIINKFK